MTTAAEARPRETQVARSARTRAALLKAARELFAEKGFAQTGREEIAERAGVTRGALYHHFASKTEVAAAVVAALETELVDLVVAVGSGVVHSSTSFGFLSGSVTTDALARYPFNLIPTFLVPLALLLLRHDESLVNLGSHLRDLVLLLILQPAVEFGNFVGALFGCKLQLRQCVSFHCLLRGLDASVRAKLCLGVRLLPQICLIRRNLAGEMLDRLFLEKWLTAEGASRRIDPNG